MNLRVSVVVPLHRRTAEFEKCVAEVLEQLGEADELIVVCDRDPGPLPERVMVVDTGSPVDTSPAEKRDLALQHVRGAICAFIDDDAYPALGWLRNAVERLGDDSVGAVGGPGITPPGSEWRERCAGAFYESPFGSGGLRYRFTPLGSVRDVDDYPAYNFFVRTEALRAVGGWASKLYGGEDTKVCLALHDAGYRIVYDPSVVVNHYRRPVLSDHCRQVANVGRHRGYFVRKFPKTSRRPIYFAPSVGLLGGVCALAWASSDKRRQVALAGAAFAVSAGISTWAQRDGRDMAATLMLPPTVFASHAAYGAAFLRGLFSTEIESM